MLARLFQSLSSLQPINLLFIFILLLQASQVMAEPPERTIRVSLRELAPFVELQNGQFTGFTYELWNAIAERRHWKSEYLLAPNVQAQLEALANKQADVGVGAISITAERDFIYDFSQPLLNAGLQIMVRTEHARTGATILGSLLELLFSPSVLDWLGIAFLLTIIPAHLVWWFERKHPQGILGTTNYFPGIFHAFFWGLGTLATQADSMPRYWVSRLIAILWMFTSVVFVAFYTAQLTASLTTQQFQSEINGPADLPGKIIGTLADTTSAAYLRSNGVQIVEYKSIAEASSALLNKDIDAVVYDAPALQYFSVHQSKGSVRMVGPVFHTEDYGFAFSDGSGLRKQVDATLLAMREDGSYEHLVTKWFGAK